jgi:hypothetical protein
MMKSQDNRKWTLSVIAVFYFLSTPAIRGAGPTLSLVQDGKAVNTVVVPDGKGALALSAARMLADTLEKASGARLTIVREAEAPAGPKVFLGKTPAALQRRLRPCPVTASKGWIHKVLPAVDGAGSQQ